MAAGRRRHRLRLAGQCQRRPRSRRPARRRPSRRRTDQRERRGDAIGLPTGAAARAHGMQLVLANTSPWLVLPLALRYLVEAVVRVIGALLLMRSVGRARDEIVGVTVAVTRPHVVVAGRRRRKRTRQRAHHEIRGLLAPQAGGGGMPATPSPRCSPGGRRSTSVSAGGHPSRRALSTSARSPSPSTILASSPASSPALGSCCSLRFGRCADRRPGVLGSVHGGRLLPAPEARPTCGRLRVRLASRRPGQHHGDPAVHRGARRAVDARVRQGLAGR